jgi:probable phosphoglycerate mutase
LRSADARRSKLRRWISTTGPADARTTRSGEAPDVRRSASQLARFPGGESLQDLVARTSDALRVALARHPKETVVMVGHDSVNKALLLQLLDQPLSAYWKVSQDPCTLNEVDIDDGVIQVRRINDTSHLPPAP